MNNPNPFIPQGSLLEQQNKKRARMKIAVLAFFGCNILLVGPLLLSGGCRHSDQADNDANATKSETAAMESSNTAAAAMAMASTNTTPSNAMAFVPPTPPPAPPTPPPAPTPAATEYTILPHDTLAAIATKNHVTLKELEAANPTVVPTKLKVGSKLTIPQAAATATASMADATSGDLYVIKSGDNLSKIATKYGTTVAALQALNNLKTTQIKVGEKLKVPAKAATATAASPMETMPATTTTASNPQTSAPILR